MDLFPGTKLGIGPVIDDGFYYDFLLPRPLTPDDLPAIEARMRESIAADHPFELSELSPAEARAFMVEHDQPFKVEIIDDLAGRRRARRRRDAADDLLPAGPVHRPVPRPARREHRQDRPVQAARHGRGVLARRREAPDAPARLRHGLGDPGGARRVPVAARGGEEARPSPARRPARPVQLPRRLAGLGVLASRRARRIWRTLEGGDARAPGAARLPGGQHADRRVASGCGASRATGTSTSDNMFIDRVGGPDVQPQADELPREHVHLPLAPALVPRPAAALQRVRPAPSQRAVRDAERPDPRPPVHPGRRAPVRPARTS